jgi:hypothetical protein
MRFSIVLVVVSISVLAGLCLSLIFVPVHANLPSSLLSKRVKVAQTSILAAAVASSAAPPNPLVSLQKEIETLENKDGTLQGAITRASNLLKETHHRSPNAPAHPASASSKVKESSFSYSPSQIAADLAKTKESKKSASIASVDAKENLQKLQKEEHNLRNEIDALLSKLERVRIVTGAHVYIADGMGGSVFEAIVSRPIGGKSSVSVIKGVDSAVDAVERKVASAESATGVHDAASFPQKEKGSDGMGGTNAESSAQKEPENHRPAVVPPKGLTTAISGDDGMGEKVVPVAKSPLVAIRPPMSPDSLSSAKPDAGTGEIVKAPSFILPSNAEPKPVINSHKTGSDGIGGTGRQLTPRGSNAGAVISSYPNAKGDGMGGRVEAAKVVGAIPREVPLTGPLSVNSPTSDGMGGRKTVHN